MAHNLSPASVGMFGQGPYDLVDFAMNKWYDQMKMELDELDLSKIGLIGRLKTGIKTRLSYQIPYQKYWPTAMSYGLHPLHFTHTLYRIHKISDHLWYVAGDNSLDINWYTKRAALSTVYATTELYMVQDNSSDFRDTWEFLDNRLREMTAAGNAVNTVQNTGLGFSKGLLAMASAFFPDSSYSQQAEDFERAKKRYQPQTKTEDSAKNTPVVDIKSEPNSQKAVNTESIKTPSGEDFVDPNLKIKPSSTPNPTPIPKSSSKLSEAVKNSL